MHADADLVDLHSFPTRRSSDLRRTASSSSSNGSTARTGPKISSRTSGLVGSASANTVGSTKKPEARSPPARPPPVQRDRKSTRLNSSHGYISYAVLCLKKKNHP